jgi:hypothetical protein
LKYAIQENLLFVLPEMFPIDYSSLLNNVDDPVGILDYPKDALCKVRSVVRLKIKDFVLFEVILNASR